jgi:hypothetical protein
MFKFFFGGNDHKEEAKEVHRSNEIKQNDLDYFNETNLMYIIDLLLELEK